MPEILKKKRAKQATFFEIWAGATRVPEKETGLLALF